MKVSSKTLSPLRQKSIFSFLWGRSAPRPPKLTPLNEIRQSSELALRGREIFSLGNFSFSSNFRRKNVSSICLPQVAGGRSSGAPTDSDILPSDQDGEATTPRVVLTTSRPIQAVETMTSSVSAETMTSSNLEELQSFLNSRLRHQRAPAAPPTPHHHHHHHYHPHQSPQLSQQPATAMPATAFCSPFHRHLSILPSTIDG